MRLVLGIIMCICVQLAFSQINRGGIYKTAEDYKNSVLTDLGVYKYAEVGNGSTLTFLVEDNLVTYKLKDLNCFGFKDQNGVEYIYQPSDEVKQVVIGGPIMMLTNGSALVNKDAMGNIMDIDSDLFYYTDGPGGKMKTIKKLLAQDTAIYDAYKADNSPLTDKALTFVMLYNQRHGWFK